jgi:hypothetical protein
MLIYRHFTLGNTAKHFSAWLNPTEITGVYLYSSWGISSTDLWLRLKSSTHPPDAPIAFSPSLQPVVSNFCVVPVHFLQLILVSIFISNCQLQLLGTQKKNRPIDRFALSHRNWACCEGAFFHVGNFCWRRHYSINSIGPM